MGSIITEIERPSKELVQAFRKHSTSTIHEAMGKFRSVNVMDPQIKPIAQGMTLFGPAVTVRCITGDNLTLLASLKVAKPGDVLVVYDPFGVTLGEIIAFNAMKLGFEGFVVDGFVRDAAAIRKLGFPIFAKGVSQQGSAKESVGSINTPIVCGGITVHPGDLVAGDDDGVVIVPEDIMEETLKRAQERDRKEAEIIKMLEKGENIFDLGGYGKKWIEKGFKPL